MEIKEKILLARTSLGIELGSTRIKAVLIDDEATPIASGSHTWENRFENGVWTYSLDDIHTGLRSCYKNLKNDVKNRYGIELTEVGSIGVSAMMHGYMAFDSEGNLLTPFRTWRNTSTAQASEELTELLEFNIPQRWSVAHLRQAMLNGEEHLKKLSRLSTLAVYIHSKLTGEFVAGVGEASGMFPIDSAINDYDEAMLKKFDTLSKKDGYAFRFVIFYLKFLSQEKTQERLQKAAQNFLTRAKRSKREFPFVLPRAMPVRV